MSVIDYYDEIAQAYDESRFSGSYGRYVDATEREILTSRVGATNSRDVIDLGCGSGRFLTYAMTGLDGSRKMLDVAASRFPDRLLVHADLRCIPPQPRNFSVGICFHVLMHLDLLEIQQFFESTAKIISPGGRLIIDCLAAPRRQLLQREKSGWHGNTALHIQDITRLAQHHWKISMWQGLLLFPIHKLPKFIRPVLRRFDKLLCRTFLGYCASYYVIELERLN